LKVSVSILSADFGRLQEAIDRVPSADMLHIDVMDGHFVPNITFGPVVMDTLLTKKPFDVHLMVKEPERFVPWFAKAAYLTFHAEATKNPRALLTRIRSLGIKAGIGIKPKTPVSQIETYLRDIDIALVMGVEPGFSGQRFLSGMIRKIRALDAYRKKHKLRFLISVDGGINADNARRVAGAGADVVVAASYVFSSPRPDSRVKSLK
jgi:ribulose-phosphate 3-epimerase